MARRDMHGPKRKSYRLAAARLLLLVLLAGCSVGGSKATPTVTPEAAISGTPGALTIPGNFATPTGLDVKIDTVLLDIYQAYKDGGAEAAEKRARETGVLNSDNEVLVTLVLTDTNTQPVADKVVAQGGRVVGIADNLIDIAVPLSAIATYANSSGQNFLQDLAAYSTVKEVRATPIAQSEGLIFPADMTTEQVRAYMNKVVTEGVQISGAEQWHASGITGKGIKIGIIDGGFKDYEKLLGKELPAKLEVKSFASNGSIGGSAHGTAVAEIVHAMAPDAELYLAVVTGPTALKQAVRWLVDDVQVQVISQSQGWHDTRGDGTGFYADQVNYARGKGVFYVKSAGNEGDDHYTTTFTDTNGNGFHEFAPGVERLEVSPYAMVYLTWDAWSGAPVNYDLYMVDQNNKVVARSANVQDAGKGPVEIVYYEGNKNQRYFLIVKAEGTTASVRLDLFGKNTELQKVSGKSTPSGSISTPGDATGSFTVGATDQKNDKLEVYSSQGPTLDGRMKPEISSPTVVSTVSYGKVGEVRSPFNGTSAACPHVSGAVALVLSAQPGATADTVQEFLQSRAKDLEEPGPENKTGYGRLQLGEPATAPAPGPASTPSAPQPTPGNTTPSGVAGPAFADPFTNSSSGLPNGGETRYENGRYIVAPQAPNRAAWATYGPQYANATVNVTVQLQGAGLAGLVFWQATDDDYYALLVAHDGAAGYVQIARYQGGRWTGLTAWTPTTVVTSGGPIALQLVTQGATIQAVVNGQALPATQAPAAGNGRVGLVAATFAQPGTIAAFTNFAVAPAP